MQANYIISKKQISDNWTTFYVCQEFILTKEWIAFIESEKKDWVSTQWIISEITRYDSTTKRNKADWIYCKKYLQYTSLEKVGKSEF